MDLVLSKIKDAIRSKPDDPELRAEYARIVDGFADHAAQREAEREAERGAEDNTQAMIHQAASEPQSRWFGWLDDTLGDEQDPTAGSSNDYATVTPISIATPVAASSAAAAAASSSKRKETAAEQKARFIREGIAYDKKLAREDKRIAKDLAYKGKRF